MADQSVRITNLPDSGSAERIAYLLYCDLREAGTLRQGEGRADYVGRHLALFRQCLRAATRQAIDTAEIT